MRGEGEGDERRERNNNKILTEGRGKLALGERQSEARCQPTIKSMGQPFMAHGQLLGQLLTTTLLVESVLLAIVSYSPFFLRRLRSLAVACDSFATASCDRLLGPAWGASDRKRRKQGYSRFRS